MEDNKSNEVHIYDGIVEQNNLMPDWWIGLFIFCCIFGFIYWLHYTVGGGVTLKEEYHEALEAYNQQVQKNAPPAEPDTEESLMAFMKNENAIHEGAEVYQAKCAICHGEQLEGKIGPNLTDKFWSTGDGSRLGVIQTIKKGSPVKGMPPWEGILKGDEIKNVASFVYSKIGSNPGNAKAPEGSEIKR